jgi:hypothetical protein
MQTTQRGIATYKMLLFNDNVVEETLSEPRGGRSPLLIESRDEFLLHRVYFKSSIQRKLYSDVLNEMETEVYLSKMMLQKIIAGKTDALLLIKRNKPSLKELKEKWPHIVWA